MAKKKVEPKSFDELVAEWEARLSIGTPSLEPKADHNETVMGLIRRGEEVVVRKPHGLSDGWHGSGERVVVPPTARNVEKLVDQGYYCEPSRWSAHQELQGLRSFYESVLRPLKSEINRADGEYQKALAKAAAAEALAKSCRDEVEAKDSQRKNKRKEFAALADPAFDPKEREKILAKREERLTLPLSPEQRKTEYLWDDCIRLGIPSYKILPEKDLIEAIQRREPDWVPTKTES